MNAARRQALQDIVRQAAEATWQKHPGWARAGIPEGNPWEWSDYHWLTDEGYVERREDFMDVWFRPTEKGWKALSQRKRAA